ncbi:hypothetical protein ACS0TY_016300 [Phlomoides rotata]
MISHNFLLFQEEGGERIIKSQKRPPENPTSDQEIQPKLLEILGKINGGEEEDNKKKGEAPNFEEEDGYRTPTSPEHRIPAITECPPAPKRTRPPGLKLERKLSPAVRRRLQYEATTEVELIFCRVVRDEVVEKIKKTPTTDGDGI